MDRTAVSISLLLCLAACQPNSHYDGQIRPTETCGAIKLLRLIGQPASQLATMTLPDGTRIIRPGDAVTEDYSASRLNIGIDLHETIGSLYCG